MSQKDSTYILIAPGFDLVQVAMWTAHIRSRGCRVAIVGLTPGVQRSTNGVHWVPDLDLDQVQGDHPGLVLLPGGGGCAAALARDPRVLHFLGNVRESFGHVAGAREVRAVLADQQLTVVPSMDREGPRLLDNLIAYQGDEGRGRCLPVPGGEVEAPGMIGGS
jgi:putative intracellular protease/amidase